VKHAASLRGMTLEKREHGHDAPLALAPGSGAVPTVTELYAEIARLEFFIGSQAKFIEEQRVVVDGFASCGQRDERDQDGGSPFHRGRRLPLAVTEVLYGIRRPKRGESPDA
jgi:hypothetical protein